MLKYVQKYNIRNQNYMLKKKKNVSADNRVIRDIQ